MKLGYYNQKFPYGIIADGFIKLEAIRITTHLPHGSIYYTVVLKAPCMCGVLKCYGPVACKLNICVYAPFILGLVSQ